MGKKASDETYIKHMRLFKNGRLCARLSGIDVNYEMAPFCGYPLGTFGRSCTTINMVLDEITPYGKRLIRRSLRLDKPLKARLHLLVRQKDKRLKRKSRVTYNVNGFIEKIEPEMKPGSRHSLTVKMEGSL